MLALKGLEDMWSCHELIDVSAEVNQGLVVLKMPVYNIYHIKLIIEYN